MPLKPPSRGTTTVDVHAPPSRPTNDYVPRPDSTRPSLPSLHPRETSVGPGRTQADADLNAITPAPPVHISEMPSVTNTRPVRHSLEDYRVTSSVQLPEADAQGFRRFKGRLFVDLYDGSHLLVGLDAESGLYRARLSSELTPSGPIVLRDPDSRLWHPLIDFESMTFSLSARRLEDFRAPVDFSNVAPDSDGLHRFDGKLYVVMHDRAYQALHDLDASSPHVQVMRIVRAQDPVARDEQNRYIATRPGRSQAIVYDERIGWSGLILGGAGGMFSGQGRSLRSHLANQLNVAVNQYLRSQEGRVRKLYPSFDQDAVKVFIDSLGDDVAGGLARRETEYATLKQALKSWVRENVGPNEAWPTTVASEILRCWRRETGTTLKLPSGRGALPALKANFEHIQKIELQGITWSDSAETFLAHFPRLTSLTIIESGLNTLPAPISAMPELVTLDLRSNHIVLDRQNATALSNLVRLQRIDLSGNALGMTPDFGNMPDLKVLNLSHTAIDQWPAGLQTQTGLELIDLRFNQLREVPPAQLDPAAEQLATMARINGVTLLDGNPFPNDYWRHFDRYWQRLWNSHPNLAINARTDAFDFASPPIQRLRHIHPNKSITEAREFLRRLGQDTEAELARLEREFQTLEDQLGAWSFSGGGARQRYVRANQMQIAAGMLGDRYEAQARLFACWRQETPQKLAYDGTPIGLELDLSGLTLPSLPDLDVDFSHVGSLKLNNMSLSASPEGFLSRFRHVRWLDLSNNQLRDLPPALGQMHGMTRLFLQNNQIVLTPETARILSERVTLRALVLEGNPLGITPDFSGITDIRSLNLSNIGIDTWPRGLSEQPALDTILLRNNLITTIPDSVIAPSDALLSQMIRINSVTDVSGNPLSDATLEQVRQFGERQTAQGTPATGSPNRLVLTAQIRPNETPFGRSAGIAFERWTQGMLQAQFAAKQAQWQTLIGQQGAEPFFNVLDRLSSNRAGHTDLQRRVWGVLDAISENSPESERLRREMFDRAGEPACCDRAAFSFSNLEVLAMVYSAHKKAGDHGQGQHLANLSRRLFRLHEVDRLAAEDIQRSEAIVRDPQMSFEEKRPHILRLREEVEIRLAYRFGLKAALELPGQPEKAHFLGMAGVSEEMLSKARKTVIDLDNSPAERQALLSREFWKDYLTNKYRQQFEEQRLPYQDRLADLHESLVAKQMTDQQYQSRSDDLQAQLAIEEATLMQELTRQELDHPSAAGRSTDL